MLLVRWKAESPVSVVSDKAVVTDKPDEPQYHVSNYKIAAVIGIMVFIVTAVISLIVYNVLPSVKDEEGFQ